MNKRILTLASCALFAGSLTAAPFMAVGTSAEIFVTADLELSFNDNVTLGSDVIPDGATEAPNPVRDDTVWRFTPGLSYEFGRNALISGNFSYQEQIVTYSDNSDLDTNLSNVAFNARHDDGSSKTTVAASYRELNQNTVDVRLPGLSRREVARAKFEHEMEFSAKSSVMFGLDWADTNYERGTLQDRVVTRVPLRYYWEASPKVDLSFGGAYRRSDTDFSRSSSDDLLVNLGARGDFTAKLKGFVRVGLVDRSLDDGRSRSSINIQSNLTYLYSEKTTLNFGVGNDFGNSGAGENQENFDVFLGFRSEIAADFALNGRISLREIDYFSRASDDFMQASLGGEYTVNEYFSVLGRFNFQDNDSGLATGDFDATVFSLMAKLRY
ncbi:MAG: hypothetical protein SynsKO_23810 [Synoicihabitans sp.]